MRWIHVLLVYALHMLASFPVPRPAFHRSTVKRAGPGTFPHVSDVKGRKG